MMNVSNSKDGAHSFSVSDYLPTYLGPLRAILSFILDRLFGLKALSQVYSKSRGLEPQIFVMMYLRQLK